MKCFSEYSSLIVVLATVALCIITFFYLYETRLIRAVAKKTFLIETAPKIFLETITPKVSLDEDKKQIAIVSIIKFRNIGKIEAEDFSFRYKLSYKDSHREGEIGPLKYLFPTQQMKYETKIVNIDLNEEQFAIAKKAKDTKMALNVPVNFIEPVFLELDLSYRDQEDN